MYSSITRWLCIERDNSSLKDVLPKDYARPNLDKQSLGRLIDLISDMHLGDEASRSKDMLGRVYEYFLAMFASAEGKRGGEFYTPRCIVNVLVEMLEPYRGRVFDPCCGSGGMFVQSMDFIDAHTNGNGNGGRAKDDISIYGQESNYTTWRLAKMNLAIRGIEGQIEQGDSFHNDRHPDLKADFILANPHFNDSDWGGELLTDDQRWRYGTPPRGNANFAWVQHMVYHLSPRGVAGIVLANGSMSSNQSNEGEIRKEPDRERSGGLHDRVAGSAFLLDADTSVPVVSGAGPARWRRFAGSARADFIHRCSEVGDGWYTGRIVSWVVRILGGSQIRITLGAAGTVLGEVGAVREPPLRPVPNMRMLLVSASLRSLEEVRKSMGMF